MLTLRPFCWIVFDCCEVGGKETSPLSKGNKCMHSKSDDTVVYSDMKIWAHNILKTSHCQRMTLNKE